jgi:hypothetical protein
MNIWDSEYVKTVPGDLPDIDLHAALLECVEWTSVHNPPLPMYGGIYKDNPLYWQQKQASYRKRHPDKIKARSINTHARSRKKDIVGKTSKADLDNMYAELYT